ncbi:FxLD family lanthipeptide [Streptomyces angustmyceticus]|uniref:FxLD family lanthipeptide n=1 Tax=Streptomyces angustmyceticus TaxID=285578 RepID=UPI0021AFA7F6|nr:FxLD family lanthipeptide [Streptomyces angustmyceticus]
MAQQSSTMKTGTSFTSGGSDFDLKIETIATAPVIGALLNDTGDGCTATCESACSNSTCE